MRRNPATRNTTRAAYRHHRAARRRERSRRSPHRGPPDRPPESAAPARDREQPVHRERSDAERPCARWSPDTRPEGQTQTTGYPAPLPGQYQAERPSHASRAETPRPNPLRPVERPREAPELVGCSPSPAKRPKHRKARPGQAPARSESDRATPACASPRAAPVFAAA